MKSLAGLLLMAATLCLAAGCSSYQPTKNAWKSTKGFWNAYVSPPASVNYDDKNDLGPMATALSTSMINIDMELNRLERLMENADKPPTKAWVAGLFSSFPWVSGFAGVKYDGTILGKEPASQMKELDYNPLLYEDKRQSSRALRAYAENTPLGPEVILATPLFDGMDFLGVVAANFDMRNLMTHSSNADSLVVLTPMALLWPGKYDYAATPLAKVDWDLATRRSSSGTCSNDTGTFYYIVRYLANLPMVFAVPSKGTFPDGDGNVNQGLPFFPKEVEKLPPPKLENTPKGNITPADMLKESPDETAVTPAPAPAPAPAATATPMPMSRTEQRRLSGAAGKDIQPGSRESVLLRGKSPTKRRQMEERDLEGENVPVERAPRRRTRQASEPEEDAAPPTQFRRPSPFGSSSDDQSSQPDPQGADRLASPPEDEAQTPDETGSSGQRSGLPRRPSPFGGGSQ